MALPSDILSTPKKTTEELYTTTLNAISNAIPNYSMLKASVQSVLVNESIPQQSLYQDGLYSLFPVLTAQQAPSDVVLNLGQSVGLKQQDAILAQVELTFTGSPVLAGQIIPSGTIVQNLGGSILVTTTATVVLNANGVAVVNAISQSDASISAGVLTVCGSVGNGVTVTNTASSSGLPAETTQQYYSRVQEAMAINRIGAQQWTENLIQDVEGVRGLSVLSSTQTGQLITGSIDVLYNNVVTSGITIQSGTEFNVATSTVPNTPIYSTQTITSDTGVVPLVFTTTELTPLAQNDVISGAFTVYTATGAKTCDLQGIVNSFISYQQNAYNLVVAGNADQNEVALAILKGGIMNTNAVPSSFNTPINYQATFSLASSSYPVSLPYGLKVSTATSQTTLLPTSFVGYLTTSSSFTVSSSPQSFTGGLIGYSNQVPTNTTLHIIDTSISTFYQQNISVVTTNGGVVTDPVINVNLFDVQYPQNTSPQPNTSFYKISYVNAYTPTVNVIVNATTTPLFNQALFTEVCQDTVANYFNGIKLGSPINVEYMNSLIKQNMLSNNIPLSALQALSFTIKIGFIDVAFQQTTGIISPSPSTYGYDAYFNMTASQVQTSIGS